MQKEPGFISEFEVRISDSESLKAIYYKTNMGFEYKISSPFTNKTILINEKGLLKTV